MGVTKTKIQNFFKIEICFKIRNLTGNAGHFSQLHKFKLKYTCKQSIRFFVFSLKSQSKLSEGNC